MKKLSDLGIKRCPHCGKLVPIEVLQPNERCDCEDVKFLSTQTHNLKAEKKHL